MTAFIQLDNVSFTYPSAAKNRPTLHGINLSIRKGEFVALIGANGSGKSTLVRLLNALLIPDTGRVISAGLDTRDPTAHPTIRSQVGMVFQKPQDQIVAMTVEEDIAFGPANLGLPHTLVQERVEQAMHSTGLAELRERPSYLLSAGEGQRLALAGVLAMQPQCVIFDESTAMLDPPGRAMVLNQAKRLHKQGITTILITHLMDEAAAADRVIILNEGQLVMDGSPASIFNHPADLAAFRLDQPGASKTARSLQRFFPAMEGRILLPEDLLNALPPFPGSPGNSLQAHSPAHASETPLIDIQKLSHSYMQGSPLERPALVDLSIQIQPAGIHGLIGGTGSGKSTLLQHMNGLLLPQSGSVRVAGFHLNNSDTDLRALRKVAALAFQQPEDQLFKQYVGDEIAYGPRMLGYEGKIADVVRDAMQLVGLDFETYRDRLTSTLSGGEKRKVALASVLAVQPEILLLDEPLAGLDPHAGAEIVKQLRHLHDQGTTLLVSTHQYDELLDILDHVSVILRGSDILHGTAGEVFSQVQELENAGLQAPLTARAAWKLRSSGWPLPAEIVTLPGLVHALDKFTGAGTT